MIVVIEGAPGVGKSTLAGELGRRGARVIPEVNLLFARPVEEPAGWYYDRQNARWEMAVLGARDGELVVLDGDVYQPVWFNWIYRDEGYEDWRRPLEFFACRMGKGRMGLPDRYVVLRLEEGLRRERMMARELARGKGVLQAREKTERYARMVEPQLSYFRAMAARWPGWVVEVESGADVDLEAPAVKPEVGDWIAFVREYCQLEIGDATVVQPGRCHAE